MPGLRALQILAFIVFILSGHGGSLAAPTISTPLLDQGPLGARLRSAAPAMLANVETTLRQIIESGPPANDNMQAPSGAGSPLQGFIASTRRRDTPKGQATPTPAERREIAANPAFARAYANEPAEVLQLLRRVERIIEDAQK